MSKKITIICPECKKSYTGYRYSSVKQRVYCSRKCESKHRKTTGRWKDIEFLREYRRKKYKRLYSTVEGKRKIIDSLKRNYNKEKAIARSLVRRALLAKEIVKPKICSVCKLSKNRIEAHHSDYSKPLKVKWVCTPCHYTIHHP